MAAMPPAEYSSVDMAELAGIPKKVPQPQLHAKRAPAPQAPEAYTVETVSGGKITVAKVSRERLTGSWRLKDLGGILKLDGTKRSLSTLGGIVIIMSAGLCPVAMAQGAVPPSTQQPAATGQQSAAPAQQAEPADNFVGNQVLHILVGHSVVIRTDARLRRVLVGNPTVITTSTTAANELVVTAIASGSSSVVLWQEDNKSRILEVFGDVDVSLLREAVARGFPTNRFRWKQRRTGSS